MGWPVGSWRASPPSVLILPSSPPAIAFSPTPAPGLCVSSSPVSFIFRAGFQNLSFLFFAFTISNSISPCGGMGLCVPGWRGGGRRPGPCHPPLPVPCPPWLAFLGCKHTVTARSPAGPQRHRAVLPSCVPVPVGCSGVQLPWISVATCQLIYSANPSCWRNPAPWSPGLPAPLNFKQTCLSGPFI